MEKLPQEIIIEILEYLSFEELLKLENVNKRFLKIIRENKWKNQTADIRNKIINMELLKKFVKKTIIS